MNRPWRVGRTLGRTLYIKNGGDPKDDTFVGVMDTRELADVVVAAVNARDILDEVRAKVLALEEHIVERGDLWIPVNSVLALLSEVDDGHY
jgi:hypothetical protein